MRLFVAIPALLLVAAGCDGLIGEPGESVDGPRPPGPIAPSGCEADVGLADLHRLSSDQYENTVRDLFGGDLGLQLASMSEFPETRIEDGFANDAEANIVNESESNAIEDNAEQIAAYLLADASTRLPEIMSCVDPGFSDADVDACIDTFIAEFGLRAYRRPLTTRETELARGLYDANRPTGAAAAWAAVMQLFLQAPATLYRVERGADAVEGSATLVHLTDWEMASRLSYFFLNSMPDAELFDAAAAGQLSTPEQIEIQARRLIDDPRVTSAIDAFHRDWLKLYRLDEVVIPDAPLSPAMRDALAEESRQLVRHVLEDGDGRLATLLGTSSLPVNSELEALYGVSAGSTGPNDWVMVDVPNRFGLLTQAGTMVATAHEGGKDPTIMRGVFMLENIMCADLPTFPDNADVADALAEATSQDTARDRLAPTLARSDCSSCHGVINVPGFALENYDLDGSYRQQQNGATIDASGEMLVGVPGAFSGPGEFVQLLANSEQVHQCYARQWFRFAAGRPEAAEDACDVDALAERFTETGDIRELMIAVTRTTAFLYRRIEEGGR